MKFYLYKKGGGGRNKSVRYAEGGHNKYEVVLMRELEGGGGGGAKSFRPAIVQLSSPALPLINDQSLTS